MAPKLIICRGLPASGKSTFAKRLVARDPAVFMRVNRDDLRSSIYGGWHQETENTVRGVRNSMIREGLKRGLTVISDDTNLPLKTVKELVNIARSVGAEWAIEDFTNVSVEECIKRDGSRRDGWVGKDVILGMHKRFIKGRSLPLEIPDTDDEVVEQYVPNPALPDAYIVDIDGTVAIKGDRSPYDETRVSEDTPNMPVIEIVQCLSADGAAIVFVSGRSEDCRADTQNWLVQYVALQKFDLFMRASGDKRKDSIVKREIFEGKIKDRYAIQAVFDDRNQVVDMWRSLGLTCLQVAPGDF